MHGENLYIFDACAVIAFLQDEPGAEQVETLLKQDANQCLLHVINACEVYYDVFRRDGEIDANHLESVLEADGFELRDSLESTFWRRVGKLKAELRRLSLADCFALALAIQEKGTLVTSDHHEFDRIVQENLCPIYFIR